MKFTFNEKKLTFKETRLLHRLLTCIVHIEQMSCFGDVSYLMTCTPNRKTREMRLIFKLRTAHPLGIDERFSYILRSLVFVHSQNLIT